MLVTAVDSNVYLFGTEQARQSDTGRENEIAVKWSEAAVKANHINVTLSADCLSLAKAFSESGAWDEEQIRRRLNSVDAVFEKVRQLLA